MKKQSMHFDPAVSFSGRECAGTKHETGLQGRAESRQSPGKPLREVWVMGTAEVSCPADRACVRFSVGNSKESVNEVTNSVTRRLEYILQTVRQNDIGDRDTSVRKFLHQDADQYHMDAQVLVTFSDFEKMEKVCSFLLEKLDKSVCIGAPQFYHSPECLSKMRSQACVSAVKNAQQKACEITQLLGQTLGPPLLVKEEEMKEWKDEDEEEKGTNQGAASPPQLPFAPTVTAFSRVSVSFSLRVKQVKNI